MRINQIFNVVIVLFMTTLFMSCSSEDYNVAGKLLGLDGRPLELSNINVLVPIEKEDVDGRGQRILQSIEVDPSGAFKTKIDYNGAVYMEFVSPLHKNYMVPVYLSDNSKLKIQVKLAPVTRGEDLSEMAVVGDFNDYDLKSGNPMKELEQGKYQATIEHSGDTLIYMLYELSAEVQYINVKYPGALTNNPSAEGFIMTEEGQYQSFAVPKDGKAEIFVDANLMPLKKEKGYWFIEYAAGDTKYFAETVYNFQAMAEDYREKRIELKIQEAGPDDIKKLRSQYDWQEIVNQFQEVLANENVPKDLKKSLLTYYTAYAGSMSEMSYNALNPELSDATLQMVEPSSNLWGLFQGFNNLRWANHHDPVEGFDTYFDELIQNNPSDAVIKSILVYDIGVSKYEEDSDRFNKYGNILVEKYPGSPEAEKADKMLQNSRIQFTTVPQFSIADLDNPSLIHSDVSFKGKFYLIDFWGTWCIPCIAEMPYLHEAYDNYKDSNFTILSLAWDRSPETIQKFRSRKWNMPWHHGLLSGYKTSDRSEDEMLKKFKVIGFPTTILVAPDGTVLARGPSLREEKLDKTLSQYLKGEAKENQ